MVLNEKNVRRLLKCLLAVLTLAEGIGYGITAKASWLRGRQKPMRAVEKLPKIVQSIKNLKRKTTWQT